MTQTQTESRQTLRPIPVVPIEAEGAVPRPVKREGESVRPVVAPAVDAASSPADSGLSRQAVLRWTVASGFLGVIALLGGAIAFWQPGPHAASPVLPDAVRVNEPARAAEPDPLANPERAALAPPPEVALSKPQAVPPPSTNATKRKAATSTRRAATTTQTSKGTRTERRAPTP